MRKIIFIIAIMCLFAGRLFAYDDRISVGGAAPLSKGVGTFTLNLGSDVPRTILYGLKFDYGLTDWYQIGVGGSSVGIISGVEFNNTINFIRNDEESHYVSLLLNPGFMHFYSPWLDGKAFTIYPTLVYEFRFGEEKKTGFFLKTGTGHWYASFGSDLLESIFKGASFHENEWFMLYYAGGGFVHRFGDAFSLIVETKIYIREDFGAVIPQGQIGLTWAF